MAAYLSHFFLARDASFIAFPEDISFLFSFSESHQEFLYPPTRGKLYLLSAILLISFHLLSKLMNSARGAFLKIGINISN